MKQIAYAIQKGRRIEVYMDDGEIWDCEGELKGFTANSVVVKMWGYNQTTVYGSDQSIRTFG